MYGMTGLQYSIAPAALAESLGVPAIIKVTTERLELGDKPGLKQVLNLPRWRRNKLREMSGVVCVTEAIAGEVRDCGVHEDRIITVPNGVDTDFYRPASHDERRAARAALGYSTELVILVVAELTSRKRQHLACDALLELAKRGVSADLICVGTPREPYASFLHRYIATSSCPDRIRLLGYRADVRAFLCAADIFLLPSEAEGLPNSLLEAMASGLPCVATPFSGVKDVFDNEQYGVVSEATGVRIADAIQKIVATPGLRDALAGRARQRVVTSFSLSYVRSSLFAEFQRVVTNHHTRCISKY